MSAAVLIQYPYHAVPELNRILARFFRDKDLKYKTLEKIKFKYFGGTWILHCFVGIELYWIHASFNDSDEPTYKSSWNDFKNDFRSMKYIMQNHPNLYEVRKKLKRSDKYPEII